MLTRLSAAIVGLLAFAGCILVGLVVDNPLETTLLRALGGLAGGMVLGSAVGWFAQRLVEENFRKMVSTDVAEEMRQAAQANAPADDDATGTSEPRADKNPGGAARSGPDATDATGATGATATVSDEDETLASQAARRVMGQFPTPAETPGETAVHG
ncbi:MAG: hypothetical protein ACOC95_08350 [Planctomycetota bacterium]